MKIPFTAIVIFLSLVLFGTNNPSMAKGKTAKKTQTTHLLKKSITTKTSDMHKSGTSAMKTKKQIASAKYHKMHKMKKSSKFSTKSHKISAKTSKTSTKPKKDTPKSKQ
jgi:hypothetical protein